jgi:hypothetical protein
MQSDKLLDGMQTNVHLMGGGPQEDVGDICNASLKKIVDWAKHMQMYVMISNSVLLKLIKNTWGELLCFMLAIRCSREPHMQLGGAQGSQLLNSTFYTQRVSGELKSWIIERQLTHHELACLKAVILFNPGMFVCYLPCPHFCMQYTPSYMCVCTPRLLFWSQADIHVHAHTQV